jgi:small subunit ribosomal protein S6
MKHRYEGLLVLNLKGKEDSAQKVIERLEKEIAAEGAKVESVQKMEHRHLSYVKGKLDSGYFVNFVFSAEPAVLDSIRARFKLDEEVYRQQFGRVADKKKAA